MGALISGFDLQGSHTATILLKLERDSGGHGSAVKSCLAKGHSTIRSRSRAGNRASLMHAFSLQMLMERLYLIGVRSNGKR
jgi:hypothetical protein